ncbi:MAG: hypothetical protein KDC65_11565 [Saprospiraceae bacterium]|nr:hypothetical protein [Saprospiraceae bacterium]
MLKTHPLLPIFSVLALFVACTRKATPENPDAWQKIKFNLNGFDENGLRGPANGKVALEYEYCIPAKERHWKAIKKIDPSAKLHRESRGRVGCGDGNWLVTGNTHQTSHKRVLYLIASQDFVTQILENFYE